MTDVYDVPPPGALRPSSAYRWGNCAGSHALEGRYPQEDGEEARQGTAAHFYVTEYLQGREWPVGHVTPNGVPIDAEMVECGQGLIDLCKGLGAPLHVEHGVTMHATVHPACEGTPDVFHLDFDRHRLTVPDYKYGHHYVDPFRNEQLCLYVAGIFEFAGLTKAQTIGWEIHLIIAQPRNYHPSGPLRRWETLGAKVWAEIERLQEAAHRAKEPNAGTITGPWCRDCTGRHACEALRRVGSFVLDVAGASLPQEMTPAAVGLYLKQLTAGKARLEALLSGLETVALATLRTGGRIPGWGVEHGKGREKWNVPVPEVIALGDALGIPLGVPAAITPNMARKAGLDPELVKAYATTPIGEAKLAPSDATNAAKAFG